MANCNCEHAKDHSLPHALTCAVSIEERSFAPIERRAASERSDAAYNHPNHYGGDTVYETIKVLEAWGLDRDFLLGNCVKYISRAGKKDPAKELEDLRKAKFYLDRKITNLEKAVK